MGIVEMRAWKTRNPLRDWRLNRGTTAYSAAALMGVSVQALQRWESGASSPNNGSMALLADLIGEDVDDLSVRWQAWRDEARLMGD